MGFPPTFKCWVRRVLWANLWTEPSPPDTLCFMARAKSVGTQSAGGSRSYVKFLLVVAMSGERCDGGAVSLSIVRCRVGISGTRSEVDSPEKRRLTRRGWGVHL